MQFYILGIDYKTMELKTEVFVSWSPAKDLVEFVKTHNIKRENILNITQDNGGYTLFYYA